MDHHQARSVLHPLVSLEWKRCSNLPVYMKHGQIVQHKNKLYMGGGDTPSMGEEATRLYSCTSSLDKWDTWSTPLRNYTMTMFHSMLVLAGGVKICNRQLSNELLMVDLQNFEFLSTSHPPMLTERMHATAVSIGDFLIIAGGVGPFSEVLDSVEVYNSQTKEWHNAQSLPKACSRMKSCVHKENWFLVGGEGQGKEVFSVSLKDLIATSLSPEGTQPSVWKRLPDVPIEYSSLTILRGTLVSIGGGSTDALTKRVHAYSTTDKSWVYVGDLPDALQGASTVALSEDDDGDLLVVGGMIGEWAMWTKSVYKGVIRELSLELWKSTYVTLDVISRLEIATGISLKETADFLKGDDNITWERLLRVIMHQCEMGEQAIAIEEWMQDLSPTKLEASLNVLVGEGIQKYTIETGASAQLKKELDEKNEEIEQLNKTIDSLKQQNKTLKESEEKLSEKVFNLKDQIPENAITKLAGEQLCGLEICLEKRVTVKNSTCWEGFGLKLNIPEDSLPPDTDQCVITIQVSITGQYKFPKNSHLVSAIYWLRCEPSSKFTKPISIEVQHCAPLKNSSKLSIVRSHCTQKHLPYNFKKIGGMFTENSSYGMIELDGFSGFGVVQEGTVEREYYSSVYYLVNEHVSDIRDEIQFVFTWNTKAHRNVY